MEGEIFGNHSSRADFDKYLVLNPVFIKYQICVGNLDRFPSRMTNLLTQYFSLDGFLAVPL